MDVVETCALESEVAILEYGGETAADWTRDGEDGCSSTVME